jgi:hypothetical protein
MSMRNYDVTISGDIVTVFYGGSFIKLVEHLAELPFGEDFSFAPGVSITFRAAPGWTAASAAKNALEAIAEFAHANS